MPPTPREFTARVLAVAEGVRDTRVLRRRMLEVVGRVVPHTGYSWLLTDPETTVGHAGPGPLLLGVPGPVARPAVPRGRAPAARVLGRPGGRGAAPVAGCGAGARGRARAGGSRGPAAGPGPRRAWLDRGRRAGAAAPAADRGGTTSGGGRGVRRHRGDHRTARLDLFGRAHRLSARELDVVRCLAEGDDTRRAAARLHISEYTVQDHLKSVAGKTGLRSRRAVLAAAVTGW